MKDDYEALRQQLSAKEKECRQKEEAIREKDVELVEKDATIQAQQANILRLREQLREVSWHNSIGVFLILPIVFKAEHFEVLISRLPTSKRCPWQVNYLVERKFWAQNNNIALKWINSLLRFVATILL